MQPSNIVHLNLHRHEDLVRRRCRVSAPHARVVTELAGIKTEGSFTAVGEIVEKALLRLAALRHEVRK